MSKQKKPNVPIRSDTVTTTGQPGATFIAMCGGGPIIWCNISGSKPITKAG